MYKATSDLNDVLLVWQMFVGEFVGFLVLGDLVAVGFDEDGMAMGESVGFDKRLAVGESVDEEGLAVGESVGFDEGLAVGESVDEGLAVGESVGFDECLAVGELVGFVECLAVGEFVGFDEGLAVGEGLTHIGSQENHSEQHLALDEKK